MAPAPPIHERLHQTPWSLAPCLLDPGSSSCSAFLSCSCSYRPRSFLYRPVITLETLRMGKLGVVRSPGKQSIFQPHFQCSVPRAQQQCVVLHQVTDLCVFTACPHPRHLWHLWPCPKGSAGQCELALVDSAVRWDQPLPQILVTSILRNKRTHRSSSQFSLQVLRLHASPPFITLYLKIVDEGDAIRKALRMDKSEGSFYFCALGYHSPLIRWSEGPYKSRPFNNWSKSSSKHTWDVRELLLIFYSPFPLSIKWTRPKLMRRCFTW